MKQIYVGNLPYSVTKEQVHSVFAEFGDVKAIRMMMDRETGRFRGFCFVEMDDQDAIKAIDNLNGKEMAGRSLRVNEAYKPQFRPHRR